MADEAQGIQLVTGGRENKWRNPIVRPQLNKLCPLPSGQQ